jgi:hypothetical protein
MNFRSRVWTGFFWLMACFMKREEFHDQGGDHQLLARPWLHGLRKHALDLSGTSHLPGNKVRLIASACSSLLHAASRRAADFTCFQAWQRCVGRSEFPTGLGLVWIRNRAHRENRNVVYGCLPVERDYRGVRHARRL